MAWPTHFRFTFRGHFEGTPEFWSFGCHFNRQVPAGPDAGLSAISVSGVDSAIDTLMDNAFFATVTRLDDWRAYQIGTDGKTETEPLRVDHTTGTIFSGAGGMNYPTSTAVVATLRATGRGPATRGRMYLPCLAAPMSTGGRLSAADALTLATKVSAFLKSISNAIDLPGTLASSDGVLVSDRGGPGGTKNSIDHVEVGRAFDHLQSRRRNLLEEYSADSHIDW